MPVRIRPPAPWPSRRRNPRRVPTHEQACSALFLWRFGVARGGGSGRTALGRGLRPPIVALTVAPHGPFSPSVMTQRANEAGDRRLWSVVWSPESVVRSLWSVARRTRAENLRDERRRGSAAASAVQGSVTILGRRVRRLEGIELSRRIFGEEMGSFHPLICTDLH